jgi:protein-disulfide isomerase
MSTQSRAKSEEMRRAREAEAERRKKRQRLFTIIGAAVIVGLLVAITVVIIKAAGGDDSSSTSTSAGTGATPGGFNAHGGVVVGADDAPVTMTLYYDYMCPACGAFEKANGGELDKLLADDTVRIELRPISFLDKASQGTEYSTRAANDFAAVVDGAPEKVWDFHTALYANQPEENSEGLSDDELAAIAGDVGIPDSVVETFTDMRFKGWVADVTQKAFDSGVSGTPTILIDGKKFTGNPYETGPLTAAIQAAADGS